MVTSRVARASAAQRSGFAPLESKWKKHRKTTPWTPPRKAKQETMKIRLFKAQPGEEQCYAEKQAQRNGEAQDGACLDTTAQSCSRWLKTQEYASAKRILAKHNATPKKTNPA